MEDAGKEGAHTFGDDILGFQCAMSQLTQRLPPPFSCRPRRVKDGFSPRPTFDAAFGHISVLFGVATCAVAAEVDLAGPTLFAVQPEIHVDGEKEEALEETEDAEPG